ncbi:head-tail connector protein [Xanthobacter variabilis]|uniref:head-tail connector protein n=1 Tax=Xanthobacter variabilis TaxID=3119932 RepID=UPI00374F28A1
MAELLAGPAAEPLTRAEAKSFLRIDHDDEDALVDALIAAARRMVEAATGRVLLEQTWRFTREAWPLSGVIPAPVAPVRTIVSAIVSLADGHTVEVPEGVLSLKADRAPALIHVDLARAPQPGAGGIAITITAGYGATAAAVPADLMQAVRLVMAHFYEFRDGSGDALSLPDTVGALLAPYRLVRL